MVGIDVGHGPQDRGGGEQVVGRDLDQVYALGQRAAHDGGDGDRRCVARDDMRQPGRERADPTRVAKGPRNFPPAIDRIPAGFLLHLEFEVLAIEEEGHGPIGIFQNPALESVVSQRVLQCLLQVLVVVEVERGADLDQEIDDVSNRGVERRAGLVRPGRGRL